MEKYHENIYSEEQRDAEYLWNLIKCVKIITSKANKIEFYFIYHIIAFYTGI